MRRLFFIVAVVLLPASAVAVPFVLPDSEPVEEWRPILEFAQFELGPAGVGPYAQLSSSSGGWLLTVRDVEGSIRQVGVAPPEDAAAREEIASLAFSLLQPSNLFDPEPEAVAPAADRVPEPPASELEAEPAVDVAPDAPTDGPGLRRGIRAGGWFTPRGGLDVRQRVRPGVHLELSGGVRLGAGFHLGASVAAKTPSRAVLTRGAADGRIATTWELGGSAVFRWVPDLPVGPILGAGIGGLRRAYIVDGTSIAATSHPRIGLDAGLSIRAAPWARFEPMVQFHFDLLPSHPLGRPEAGVPPLPVFGLSVGLAATFSSPR